MWPTFPPETPTEPTWDDSMLMGGSALCLIKRESPYATFDGCYLDIQIFSCVFRYFKYAAGLR